MQNMSHTSMVTVKVMARINGEVEIMVKVKAGWVTFIVLFMIFVLLYFISFLI